MQFGNTYVVEISVGSFQLAMLRRLNRLTLLNWCLSNTVMPRQIRLLGLSALLCIFAQTPLVHAQDVQVRSQDGLLSIKASNASATQLADVLSEQLGISVVVTGDTETLVNVDIVEEPIDKALTKISPNNMLVRAGKSADSEIVEVVLLMGEGSQNGSAAADQFLPSGSPAEEIPVADAGGDVQASDGATLRDPNRAQMVRDAAAAASSDAGRPAAGRPAAVGTAEGLPAARQPIEYSSDVSIDPETGLPVQPQQQ